MEYMIVLEYNQDLNTLKKNVRKNLKDVKIERIIQLSKDKINTGKDIISLLNSDYTIELDNDNITREWIHVMKSYTINCCYYEREECRLSFLKNK